MVGDWPSLPLFKGISQDTKPWTNWNSHIALLVLNFLNLEQLSSNGNEKQGSTFKPFDFPLCLCLEHCPSPRQSKLQRCPCKVHTLLSGTEVREAPLRRHPTNHLEVQFRAFWWSSGTCNIYKLLTSCISSFLIYFSLLSSLYILNFWVIYECISSHANPFALQTMWSL